MDVAQQVDEDVEKELAHLKAITFRTSSVTGHNVNEIFMELTKKCLRRKSQQSASKWKSVKLRSEQVFQLTYSQPQSLLSISAPSHLSPSPPPSMVPAGMLQLNTKLMHIQGACGLFLVANSNGQVSVIVRMIVCSECVNGLNI